jgi:hypothetical protein
VGGTERVEEVGEVVDLFHRLRCAVQSVRIE